MNFYDKHNISPALARKPIVTDTIHVKRRVHFEQIRDVLGIPMEELQTFNPQYRTGLIPGDIRPYTLVLPSLQVYAYIANEDSIVNHNASKYARRDIVEPASSGSGVDSKGEYVEELVVKYHKVKKGQTLNSIAKLYGVTAASIRKTNKIGKKVRTGQTLRINTYKRKYIEPKPEVKETPAVETVQPATEAQATDTVTMTVQPSYVEHTAASDTVAETSAESKVESVQNNHVVQAMSGSNSRKQQVAAAAAQKEKTQAKAKSRLHSPKPQNIK